VESRDLAALDGLKQNIDEALVTIVFRSLVDEGQVHLFVDIDLLPYALTVDGVVFPDVLVGEGGTVLYQIALDDRVIAEGPAGSVQWNTGMEDGDRYRRVLRRGDRG